MILDVILMVLYYSLGFLYPIYASLEILGKEGDQKTTNEEFMRWVSYWCLLALLDFCIFPIFDGFTLVLGFEFNAIALLIKLIAVASLNLPPFYLSFVIYQNLVYSTEQIYWMREKLRQFGELIDLRDKN
jgi:hypothetical protein